MTSRCNGTCYCYYDERSHGDDYSDYSDWEEESDNENFTDIVTSSNQPALNQPALNYPVPNHSACQDDKGSITANITRENYGTNPMVLSFMQIGTDKNAIAYLKMLDEYPVDCATDATSAIEQEYEQPQES